MRAACRGLAVALLLLGGAAHGGDGEQPAPACRAGDGYAAAFDGRRTFLWRPDRLQATRAAIDAGGLQAARRSLMEAAARALTAEPYTVTDKSRPPASGDPHDYTSLGPYWWPDPDRRDGKPYVRRDGKFNPERDGDDFDLVRLERMSQDVRALALAYYLTEEARYAEQAARLIRAWFLDPATRMNPNFAHAQAIPGRVAGRAEGVIDAHRLPRVIESIGLLAPSGALSDAEQRALRAWFGELVQWLSSSDIGRAEQAKDNNHGLYYDMLISHFALFAGNERLAAQTIADARVRRLRKQIHISGALPEELARTRSLHYTTWTLAAAMDLADLGRCVGVEVWNWPDADRSRLRLAVDFVAPYVGKEQAWPWAELDRSQNEGVYEIMIRAGWAWDEPRYLRLARTHAARYAASPLNLLLPAFPEP